MLTDILTLVFSGFICGTLCVGLLPVFEFLFKVVTASRLLELTNPNSKLLKELMIKAPGTYHHSIMVANLAEAACERLDANSLLARAAAYYHDVGKLKNPLFFKENQIGVSNPHDELPLSLIHISGIRGDSRHGFRMHHRRGYDGGKSNRIHPGGNCPGPVSSVSVKEFAAFSKVSEKYFPLSCKLPWGIL